MNSAGFHKLKAKNVQKAQGVEKLWCAIICNVNNQIYPDVRNSFRKDRWMGLIPVGLISMFPTSNFQTNCN